VSRGKSHIKITREFRVTGNIKAEKSSFPTEKQRKISKFSENNEPWVSSHGPSKCDNILAAEWVAGCKFLDESGSN
jgi:hypothetical protein